jgi:hypothetical protein
MEFDKKTEKGIHYKFVGEHLVCVRTSNEYNGKNYIFLDRLTFSKLKDDMCDLKFIQSKVYVTTQYGKSELLHRLIGDPGGNDEVVILNDDPCDLRSINLYKVGRGKSAHLPNEEIEQRGRWIKSITDVFREINRKKDEDRDAATSLSSMNLDLSSSHITDTVTVKIGENQIDFTGLDAKDRENLISIVSTLMIIIKKSL